MKNLVGTEKQIAYAERLRKEFIQKWEERFEVHAKRGIENLNEKQIARWEESKRLIEAISNCEDASRVITVAKEDWYGSTEELINFINTGKL